MFIIGKIISHRETNFTQHKYIIILGVYPNKTLQCDIIENFILTARASAHLLLHCRNNRSRKEDARTRDEVHI